MAYPVVSAPYGLQPINLIGGQVFAGSTREYPIQYGDTTGIFYGDFVKVIRGNVLRYAVTTSGQSAANVGVFLGCYFTSPVTKQRVYSQNWPAGTAANATAIVCDDPDTVFKAVVCTSGAPTTPASGSYAMVGQNYSMIDGTGNVNNGNSTNALLYSATLTTAAFPCRVVGVVPDTASSVSATGSSSSTTITLTSALTVPLVSGTDVSYIYGGATPNGQIVRTGSFVTTAAAVGDTTVTINAATTSLGNTATVIPSSSTIVFTQIPEMLVKINFASHSYYVATAI
jgi:hypothetical protein